MSDRIVDTGRDIIEEGVINGLAGETLNTVAVGNGTGSASSSDTDLDSILYEDDTNSDNVTREQTSTDGEIRYTISVTGGTEVPADSSLREFGIKLSDGRLFYYEVKSDGIDISSGETKIIEIRIQLQDNDIETNTAVTNDGINYVRDVLTGDTTDTINQLHLGSSTTDVSQSDSSMFDTKYIASASESITDISETTNTGSPKFLVTISAGTGSDDQVTGGTDIAEFGLVVGASSTLVLHETRNPVTLTAGDEKSFSIPFEIIQ